MTLGLIKYLRLILGFLNYSLFSGHLASTSLVAQRLKRLLAISKTWVRSLGREDPLEKEMATHSSIPAWRIPLMEELQRIRHD